MSKFLEGRYRLKQDGMVVAQVEGPSALKEISHYAFVYSQDGPVEIEQHTKGRWLSLTKVPAS